MLSRKRAKVTAPANAYLDRMDRRMIRVRRKGPELEGRSSARAKAARRGHGSKVDIRHAQGATAGRQAGESPLAGVRDRPDG
jgi:hypothetical protein